MENGNAIDQNLATLPVFPTRSNTAPTPSSFSAEDSLREESRRILEKFLQRDLQRRKVGEGEGKADYERFQSKSVDSSQRVEFKFVSRSQPTQCDFTAFRPDFARVTGTFSDYGLSATISPPNRQNSLEVKSSQSTCSSFDGFKRETATTSMAGDASLSPSSTDDKDSKATASAKRKKSLFRRAKERLERTISLKRRAEEKEKKEENGKKGEKRKMKKVAPQWKKRWMKSPENDQPIPPISQRSNSEESERRFRLQFAQMTVSTCPQGGETSKKKNGKRTRLRRQLALTESTNGGTKKTLESMTPDSGFNSHVKKRRKREIDASSGSFRLGGALASGIKFLKEHSSSGSGCSPTRWLKRKGIDRRAKESEENVGGRNDGLECKSGEKAAGIFTFSRPDGFNGLEQLAQDDSSPFLNSTGIVHRVSGEFDDRSRRQGDSGSIIATGTGRLTVDIQIEPPTSTSSEPRSLISPPWSVGGLSQPGSASLGVDGRGQSAASSQDRPSSDDGTEEKYAMIAQRLAELGDAFLATKWSQLRPVETNGDSENRRQGQENQAVASRNPERLLPVELDVVEYINNCDRNLPQNDTAFHKHIIMQLIESNTSQQFDRILTTLTDPVHDHDLDSTHWTRLAIIFHMTTAAVRVVGASTNAARRLVDYCCDYVTYRFSSWIIGQGGWSSVMEDGSSGEETEQGTSTRNL